jgi:hypothetical protein
MTESTAVIVADTVELGVITASTPAQLVARATDAANALAQVIEDRKLYSLLKGKKFVRCEGWTTLAAMLGSTPHEVGVTEVDGVFTATVELRRLTDGQPIGRASAECGSPDEVDFKGNPTWASRPRYARRSMALTRATAKACRLTFSWVMTLAGFEVTPLEEMSEEPVRGRPSRRAEPKEPVVGPPTDFTEKPAALTAPEEALPFEPITRDQPCPLAPKETPVAKMTKPQLVFFEGWLEAHPVAPRAEEWLAVTQQELASR